MIATASSANGGAARLATYRRNNLRFFTVFRLHLYQYWSEAAGFDREKFATAAGLSDLGDRFWQTLQERYGEAGTAIIRDLGEHA